MLRQLFVAAAILLSLPAAAQNTFPTQDGSSVPGEVCMSVTNGVASPGCSGGGSDVVNGTAAAASGSTTISAGGTAQTLFAANSITHGCSVDNPPTNSDVLYLDFVTNAGPSVATSIPLLPGSHFECPFVPTGAVTVEMATTNDTFRAFVW